MSDGITRNRDGKATSFHSSRATAITPSDSADLDKVPAVVYCGGAGNIKVTTIAGDTVVFTAVQVGTVLPVLVKRVWSTSTTATNLVALN